MVILEIKKGDLLKANESYICQQCNCVTIKSHGLSKSISDKYSYGDPYKNRPIKTPNTTSQPDKPGTIVKLQHPNEPDKYHTILCFMAQWGPSRPNRYKNYYSNTYEDNYENRKKWFKECLEILDKNNYGLVAMPYGIGCGLAGGKWNEYKKMLEDCTTKIVIYQL